jgi:hypothetical protein
MVVPSQKFDRLEIELLKYHAPKATEGMGGALTYEVKTVQLTEIVRDLDLKGREAMIARAYSRFCKEGLVARAGFGYKLTDKGVEMVQQLKKMLTGG